MVVVVAAGEDDDSDGNAVVVVAVVDVEVDDGRDTTDVHQLHLMLQKFQPTPVTYHHEDDDGGDCYH